MPAMEPVHPAGPLANEKPAAAVEPVEPPAKGTPATAAESPVEPVAKETPAIGGKSDPGETSPVVGGKPDVAKYRLALPAELVPGAHVSYRSQSTQAMIRASVKSAPEKIQAENERGNVTFRVALQLESHANVSNVCVRAKDEETVEANRQPLAAERTQEITNTKEVDEATEVTNWIQDQLLPWLRCLRESAIGGQQTMVACMHAQVMAEIGSDMEKLKAVFKAVLPWSEKRGS